MPLAVGGAAVLAGVAGVLGVADRGGVVSPTPATTVHPTQRVTVTVTESATLPAPLMSPPVPAPSQTFAPPPGTSIDSAAPPAGASAICRDGSYSFSRHRSGACSNHGGVRRWVNPPAQ